MPCFSWIHLSHSVSCFYFWITFSLLSILIFDLENPFKVYHSTICVYIYKFCLQSTTLFFFALPLDTYAVLPYIFFPSSASVFFLRLFMEICLLLLFKESIIFRIIFKVFLVTLFISCLLSIFFFSILSFPPSLYPLNFNTIEFKRFWLSDSTIDDKKWQNTENLQQKVTSYIEQFAWHAKTQR